ncbi:MAG: cell wall-binding repeat-containing protein [Coriobacteriia bacterium]
MHITCIKETPRSRASVGAVISLLLACTLVSAAHPDRAWAVAALQTGEPAVAVLIDPSPHDGERGWRGTLTHVSLLPRAAGTIYYCWDETIGVWKAARGPLIAPQGKHTLHAVLIGEDGTVGETLHVPLKVEYRTPVREPTQYAVTALGEGDTGSVTVEVSINAHPGAYVQRIGGDTRYETGALIAAENIPQAHTVIIATGAGFADALSASGLAGCLEAPVLLTRPDSLPSAVATQIQSLGAVAAIVVGGERAVSVTVVNSLSSLGLSVRRIGGTDRYETAALIGREVMGFGLHDGRVFIARGDQFGDALSLGPLSYNAKAPLLLVRPTVVPDPIRSLLSVSAFSSGCIAGGTAAVSSQVESEIRNYVPSLSRLFGDTRYSTSVAVATWGAANGLGNYETVGVATGTTFADALCGGVAIGARGGLILLTRPGSLSAEADAILGTSAHLVNEVQVYGGEVAVSKTVIERIRQILL